MDCDTSGIILSEATDISLSTKRVLAVLLKPVDLMPAEDVVHFAHLTRPVLMLKPPNMSKITKLKVIFQQADKLEAVLGPSVSRFTALQLEESVCASLMYDVWTLPVT